MITARTAARRYARALFDVAVREQADLSRIEQDLEAFARLLDEHPSLGKVLLNPAVPASRKRAAVADIGRAGGVSLHAGRLLELLAERDRVVLVPAVLAAYRDRLLDHRQVVRAEITTAAPLAPARTTAIEESLARVTGRRVALTARVDPGVIGGVVARVGGTVYDGSVATQLEKMRQQLTARA